MGNFVAQSIGYGLRYLTPLTIRTSVWFWHVAVWTYDNACAKGEWQYPLRRKSPERINGEPSVWKVENRSTNYDRICVPKDCQTASSISVVTSSVSFLRTRQFWIYQPCIKPIFSLASNKNVFTSWGHKLKKCWNSDMRDKVAKNVVYFLSILVIQKPINT